MTKVDYQKWADLLKNRYGIANPIDTAEDEYDDTEDTLDRYGWTVAECRDFSSEGFRLGR